MRSILAAAVGLAVAGVLFDWFVRANPHHPPRHAHVFADRPPAAVRYDTGYGFNDIQHDPCVPRAGAACAALPESAAGDVEVELRDGDRVTERRAIPAAETAAVFVVPDAARLSAVAVRAGGAETVVPIAAPPGSRVLLLDRTSSPPRLALDHAAVPLARVPVDGLRTLNGGGEYATVVVRRDADGRTAVAPLARTGPGEFTSAALDLTPVSERRHGPRNAVQAVVALGCGLLAGLFVRRGPRPVVGWVRRNRGPAALFAGYAAYYGAWLVGTWPGVPCTDSCGPILDIHGGPLGGWFSLVYSLLILAVMQPAGYVGLVVFQTVAMSALMAAAVAGLRRLGTPPWVLVPVALLPLSPTVAVYTVLYQRGALNGIVTTAVLLGGFAASMRRYRAAGPLHPAAVAGLLGLALFAALLRKDNLPLAVGAVLALVVGRAVRPLRAAGLAAVMAGGYVFMTGPAERWALPRRAEDAPMYELTALMNPAGAIAARGNPGLLTPAELAAFEAVLPLGVGRTHWSPYNDTLYWVHAGGKTYTPEQIAAFRAAVVKLAVAEPAPVLAARLETFLTTVWGGRLADRLPAFDLAATRLPMARWYRDVRLARADPPVPRLHAVAGRLARDLVAPERSIRRLWNCTPQLLLVLLAAALAPRFPAAGLAAYALLARLGVVFLAAPGSYWHYIYDLHLFGLFVPAVLAAEWVARRRTRAVGPAPVAGAAAGFAVRVPVPRSV